MKTYLFGLLSSLSLLAASGSQAQTSSGTKPATATAKPASTTSTSGAATKPASTTAASGAASKPAAAKPASSASKSTATKPAFVLKNAADSMSYAIGILDGTFFKTQGVSGINANALAQGFSDITNGQTLFSAEQADQIVRTEMQKMSRKKIQPIIDEGEKFLAENAKKQGVKQTASGLQYEVIKEGSGARPADTSSVQVHYEGFLLSGKKFDSSKDRGHPATFRLNQVIRGWTEGVQLMTPGSTYRFYIPYQLGYGEQGAGENIPGGSLLIFDVELLAVGADASE
jgi:FKBP-type peptidyl-prolyl cis-trans isomerase